MTSQVVRLQTKNITDWDSFHSVFAETLGFPAFYGRNMDAWNDCMTCLDDAKAGMTTVTVSPGELFYLEVADTADFQKRVPEVLEAFIECAAFVNWRRIEKGERPVLVLVLL
jgi:RNAse (barnase) inhibitor barstar